MDRGAIVLRAAKPTLEEGLVFARYLDEAAEGFFGLMLGSAAARVVAEAFTHPDSQYSFENVTFAERERRLVGMATGFTADQHRGFSDRPLQEAEEYPALRMLAVRIVFAPLLRILSTIGDGDFYILAVAVDEALRGQGVGSVLMDAMEKRAH